MMLMPVITWSDKHWRRFVEIFVAPARTTFRPNLYQADWHMVLTRPLRGFGLGNFIHTAPDFFSEKFRRILRADMIIRNAHSEYLEVLIELGLIGMLLYLVLWGGALVAGIRWLRRERSMESFSLLTAFVVMLIHAGFSTASRHFPAGFLLWTVAGYLWTTGWKTDIGRVLLHRRRIIVSAVMMIHLFVTMFMIQVFVADFFYMRAVRESRAGRSSSQIVQRALKVFPDHPDALHNAAVLSLVANDFNKAFAFANRLDSVGPNYRATDHIRAEASLATGEYEQSVLFAEAQLEKLPRYFLSELIRARALSRMGDCEKLNKIQRKTNFELKKETRNKPPQHNTPGDADQEFYSRAGYLRAKIGGSSLRKAYERSQKIRAAKKRNKQQQQLSIINLPCHNDPPDSSSPTVIPTSQ
jgi:hypothetical protein